MKKCRFLIIFAALVCMMTALCVCADAATYDGSCGSDVTWSLDTSTGVLNITGTGRMTEYSFSTEDPRPWGAYSGDIKSVVIGDGVTSIGSYAFYGCDSLESVTIGDSVTSIGWFSFCYCTSLESVTIPDGVTSIGHSAFRGCEMLEAVIIPGSVETIVDTAFNGCTALTSVTISEGVKTIGNDAFRTCTSLSEITIPESVTRIGYSAFRDCTSLETVTVPGGVTDFGQSAFHDCTSLVSVTIFEGVTAISEYAFSGCTSLSEISIPKSVTAIKSYAFEGCASLSEITISENIASIGEYAFGNCASLETLVFENGVADIGSYAFYGCNLLYAIDFLGYAPTIGESVFPSYTVIYYRDGAQGFDSPLWHGYACHLFARAAEHSMLDGDNRNAQGILFSLNTGAKTAIVGDITSSEPNNSGYSGMGGRDVVIPEKVTKDGVEYTVNGIAQKAFYGNTAAVSFKLPSALVNIGVDAFYGCINVESYYIEPGMSKAYATDDYGVIYNANSLFCYPAASKHTDFVVPSTVNSIRRGAFYGAKNLEKLTVHFVGDRETSSNTFAYIFGGNDSSFVPSSLKNVVVSGTDAAIGAKAFYNCDSLESVTIGSGAASIDMYAFYDCDSLKTVTIGDTVASIGKSAFYGCKSLTSVTIPDSVTSIGRDVFNGCTSLSSVTFGEKLSAVDSAAFYDCTSIEKVYISDLAAWCAISFTDSYSNPLEFGGKLYIGGKLEVNLNIPSGVTKIRDYAFEGCTSFESVTIPNGVTSIGDYAFADCTSLEAVTIPESVTSIGKSAFKGCTSLKSAVITSGVNTIGLDAFKGCTSLESVTVSESVTNIGSDAFFGCTSLEAVYIKDLAAWCAVKFENSHSCPLIFARKLYLDGELVTELVIPDGVSAIGSYAFNGCISIKSIEIGENVKGIGDYAFRDCCSLKTVTIPSSVSSMGKAMLGGCAALESITLPYEGFSVQTSYNAKEGTYYYNYEYPLGYIFGEEEYTGGTKVSQSYNYHVTFGSSVAYKTGMGEFYIPSGLKDITITGGSVFDYALDNLAMLETVTIGKGVVSIGDYVFGGCAALKQIVVDKNSAHFSSDDVGVLYDKNKTTLIHYPAGRIWPFYNIADGVKVIEEEAFVAAYNLMSVLVPATVETIYMHEEDSYGNVITRASFVDCNNATLFVYSGTAGERLAEECGISYLVVDGTTLVGIGVYSKPTAEEFVIGSEFDFEGLYICSYYDGGMVTECENYDLIYDPNKLGKQTVIVKSGAFTTEFEINVVEPKAIGIKIESLPTKTEYTEGTVFSSEGLVVKLVYNSGEEREITDYVLSQLDMNLLGAQTVTVSYGEFSESFDIEIVEKKATELSVISLPVKLTYVIGDGFDTEGLKVALLYNNDTSEEVDDYTLSGFDSAAAGKYTITAAHSGFSSTFEVTVEKKDAEAAPEVPVLKERTDTVIEVETVNGCEYSIDGEAWQSSGRFEYLEFGTQYSVYARYAETETVKASAVSEPLAVKTKTPLGGLAGMSGTFNVGNELSADLSYMFPYDADISYTWQRDGVDITGAVSDKYILAPEDENSLITVTFTGSGDYCGTLVSKAMTAAPQQPMLLMMTSSEATLMAVDGCEYSSDGGETWQDSNVFTDLEVSTPYAFCLRYIETETRYASAAGAALSVQTLSVYTFVFYDKAGGEVLSEGAADEGTPLTAPTVEDRSSEGETYYIIYKFAGWDIDGDGNADTLPEKLTSDFSAYALWEEECQHKSFETETVTAAGCVDNGSERDVCLYCGHEVALRDTDPQGHDWKRSGAGDGGIEYKCTVCHATEVRSYIPGDCNGDGEVSVRDAALILQYKAGWNVTVEIAAADVNGDGEISVRDAALILQYKAGWNVTLGW